MEARKISQLAPDKVDIQKAFDEVELTAEETALALLDARQKKYARIKAEAYARKLAEPAKKYPKLKAEELWEKLTRDLPDFKIDEWNKDIVWEMCLYFTQDPRAQYDLKKGLALLGPVGCGKSTLMHYFRHNQTNSYAFFSVREISELYQKEGSEGVVRFKTLCVSSDPDSTYGQQYIGACFDDLGEEGDKKHFGNESNVMADLLMARYDRMKGLPRTHFTSNLNTTEIGERYGKRLRSRLREMMNVVSFNENAPDRRK